MVQNFLFLEDSVVDHFFISYLQQDTFLPKEKKKVSEEVYHVCPKNLNNFSGGLRIKEDSGAYSRLCPDYYIPEKAIKPGNQSLMTSKK